MILDTIPWLRPAKHDPDTVIRRLRKDIAKLLNWQTQADDHFARLTADRDDVYAAWHKAKLQRDEASTAAACMQSECERLTEEITALTAQLANATAIAVPVGVRDVDPGDQPTHPQGIDVRDLRDRFASGPVVDLHHSPQAAPGQTGWGKAREQQEATS